ncbi:hypothetical protein AKJ42_03045 [candidate division MSBL1 archaeon SCGC-AAA261C02]|uniref:ABC3 transporter permease protein domain-containing protein n=1 Tax=candidate division MSBL1 archaeon SCGC-AAA261C02 TaxID=1698272 RepID=A0A133UZB4_9EURY|nr:hypothetical protein AKJ42_03045 [candidate division MSBL1 archaeon SCGC-AAA261C02]
MKNLGRRKIRTGLTILGIAIAIAFSFILLSVDAGSEELMAGAGRLGPDIEAKVKGTQLALTTDENYAIVLEKVEGVRKATPAIMWEYWSSEKPGFTIILGMIPSDAREIYADIEVVEGRPLDNSDNFAVELGSHAASQIGLSVGDNLEFEGDNFEVVGVLEETGSIVDIMGVMPLWSLQSALQTPENKASGIWIWVEDGANVGSVMTTIENDYPELSATEGLTMLEYTEEFTKFGGAIRLIVLTVAILIGTLAAMNTVAMTTFERTREFGTMRALGASGGYVFKLVLIESILLCVIGGLIGSLLGFVGSLGAESIIMDMVGLDIVAVPLTVPATAIGIAIIVGLVAGIYPARRVSKQEIVEALRYE